MSRPRKPERAEHGELQRQILAILLSQPECTVRQVHDRVSADRPIAYTTVLTVMTRMAERGLLVRRREGKSGVFRVAQSSDPQAAGQLIDQLIGQFGAVAATEFVSRARANPELLQQLRDLLEED